MITITAVLLYLGNITYAPSVSWDTTSDWSSGTHYNTQNLSGNLLLNDTLGVYEISGYYISKTTTSSYPVCEILPIWNSTEPDENINISIELSVNGGQGWCLASNNTGMNSSVCSGAGFGSGYNIVFRANFSTNDTSQTPDLHNLDLDYTELIPFMEVDIKTPYDNTVIGQNRTFVVNATLYCRDSNCGNVNGTVRYNKSSLLPDEAVSTVSGDAPFYIIDSINTKDCTTNPLTQDEYCSLAWTVNATGNLSSVYEIDVLLESDTTQSNNTGDSTIEIGKVLIIGLEFDEVDFGILDPGEQNQPAENNIYGYNISVDVSSNDVENLWIKGTNLTNDNSDSLDCDVHEQYNPYEGNTTNYPCLIDVSNVMWGLEPTPAPDNKYNLSGTYERVNKDMQAIPAGSYETTYYWISVPYGVYAGPYTGILTFMTNATW